MDDIENLSKPSIDTQTPAPHEDDDVTPSGWSLPAAPESAPRTITSHVRQRLWAEPRVRIWWLGAIVLTVIGSYFVLAGIRARAHEFWLIKNGVNVDAFIEWADQEHLAHRKQAPDSVIGVKFLWKGKEFEPFPRQLPGRRDYIETASTLRIHVNPSNPDDWTWLDEPLPLLTQVIGGIITLPMALMSGMWALMLYLRAARAWRHGPAEIAVVLRTHIAAIAPFSKGLDVTNDDLSDRRVYRVFVPGSLAHLQAGNALYIVRASSRSKSAVAALWVE